MTRSDTNWSVQSQRKARSLLLDRCPNGQIISQSLNLPLLFSNTNKLNSENFEKIIGHNQSIIMHQSFVSPAPLAPGIAEPQRG